MLELLIKKEKTEKKIALVNNGILEEYYEDFEDSNKREGDIYIGIVRNIIEGMQSAFVDIGAEKNSFIHLKDVLPKVDETIETQKENVNINDILKPGQKIFVQVKKDSNSSKGARVSTHINLPSKYIAFMPNTDIVTVSQKIEDKKEQQRLVELVKKHLSKGNGAVIRTSAMHKEQELIDDIKYIENKWKNIISTNIDPNDRKPRLIYKSEDIIEKMLIDLADKNLETIILNDKDEAERIQKLKEQNKEYQNIKIVIKPSEEILKLHDTQKQIDKLKDRKIWLKCGGFITIDKTEALTAIDVNTGKYTGNNDLEKTIFTVNKEATVEIAKQIKLRDIGGIIIVDYIDMHDPKSKDNILKILLQEVKKDRAKTQVEGFTNLDLMELTRKHICSHKE